jgi:serine/threonine-protein kinase RsbW
MTLTSNPKNIGKVEAFLNKVSRNARFDEIQMNKLMISLTEAVNNGIIHGNKSNPKKKVKVVAEILPGWVLFMISDQGAGFRPENVKNPLAKENLTRESGRGVFLMRTLMDKVEFEGTKEGMLVKLWLDLAKG